MKKLLLVVGVFVLIAVLGIPSGCITSTQDNTPSIPPTSTPPTTPEGDISPPENVTWISPGKVTVGNFYPGATAEYPLTIHNGNDVITRFIVSYRYPDNTATGYESPSPAVQDWVIIADLTPILAPFETREIMVVLMMPEDAVVFAEHWEFWVSVSDASQTGIVTTAMASRWLIDMRSS